MKFYSYRLLFRVLNMLQLLQCPNIDRLAPPDLLSESQKLYTYHPLFWLQSGC